MSNSRSPAQLINFETEAVDAINELLAHVGIATELGPFLDEHLTQVLRAQHQDVVISSIMFRGANDCSGGGNRLSEGSPLVEFNELCIPVDLTIVLVSNNRTHHLDLQLRINAKASDGGFDVNTDLLLQGGEKRCQEDKSN